MNRLLASLVLLAAGFLATGRADEKLVLGRVAFGSCARQDKPQPIWDPIVAGKPQRFLFLGDNIYGDTKDMEVMREKYALLAKIPGYLKLRAACPILGTWDDHDYGVNDGGADYPKKDESQVQFLDFLGVAKDSPRRAQKGIYHAEVFGPPEKRVQIIVLDTRYFRGPLAKRGTFIRDQGPYVPSTDKTSTMLGEAQWKWLEEQLKVPAKIRILASSIQVVPQDHGWEKWMNLPHERERLYQLLKDTKAAGVIVLSGDRHLAELSVMDAGLGYPLYDLTSSGLNFGSPVWRKLEVNRHRVGTMNAGNNYGAVNIDWDKADPVIALQIRDEVGDVVIQEKITLSLLQPGAYKSKAGAKLVVINEKAMTPDLVKELLKKEVTLEMTVVATGASAKSGMIFLNSATDRKSEDNFTVVLDKKAQEGLKAAGIADARAYFEGKAIAVTGTLSLFNGAPQIVVSDAKQIQGKD